MPDTLQKFAFDDEVAHGKSSHSGDSDEQSFREKQQLADNQHRDKITDLGFLGKWLGGGEEKTGNIVFILAVFSLVLVFGLAVTGLIVGWEHIDAGLTGMTAVVSICLGYIIGRK